MKALINSQNSKYSKTVVNEEKTWPYFGLILCIRRRQRQNYKFLEMIMEQQIKSKEFP